MYRDYALLIPPTTDFVLLYLGFLCNSLISCGPTQPSAILYVVQPGTFLFGFYSHYFSCGPMQPSILYVVQPGTFLFGFYSHYFSCGPTQPSAILYVVQLGTFLFGFHSRYFSCGPTQPSAILYVVQLGTSLFGFFMRPVIFLWAYATLCHFAPLLCNLVLPYLGFT